MEKREKIILILAIGVMAALPSTFVLAKNLEVEFEKTPLFEETNFLPGQSVTRWVKVTNNSGQSQRVATEAINYPGFISGTPRPHPTPANDLSRALLITVREKGGNDLYGGSTGHKSLYDFYQNGETYLSDILAGQNKEYEFEIAFPIEKGNEWQGATTSFDILIGFQGREGGPPPLLPPGGPGLPPGLTILEETATTTEITTTSVTIVWTTNYFSTSKVIYATTSGLFNLGQGEPSYGYTYYKEGDDSGLEKVTAHSVTITGLTPGTTYYYRCVSHGSFAISREYSFTTLGIKKEEIIPLEERIVPPPEERIVPPEEKIPPEEIVSAPPEEVMPAEEVIPPEEEVVVPPEKVIPEKEEKRLASLLLASLTDSWEGFQRGEFFNNPIFWASMIFVGFLLSGFSLIDRPRMVFGTLGFIGILGIAISSFYLPLPIVKQLRFPLPDFIAYPIGILLFLFGLSIIFLAMKKLSPKTASNIVKSKDLVTSGVYGIVRHPLYLGLILAYLGWCFIFKALLSILFSPFVLIFLLILIFFEEKDLIKTYGFLYQQYKQKIPNRIIPKIL